MLKKLGTDELTVEIPHDSQTCGRVSLQTFCASMEIVSQMRIKDDRSGPTSIQEPCGSLWSVVEANKSSRHLCKKLVKSKSKRFSLCQRFLWMALSLWAILHSNRCNNASNPDTIYARQRSKNFISKFWVSDAWVIWSRHSMRKNQLRMQLIFKSTRILPLTQN